MHFYACACTSSGSKAGAAVHEDAAVAGSGQHHDNSCSLTPAYGRRCRLPPRHPSSSQPWKPPPPYPHHHHYLLQRAADAARRRSLNSGN